jgi:hypothetical protein
VPALAIFVTGALLAEVVSGQVLVAHGHREAYVLVTPVEELREVLGVVLVLGDVLGAVRAPPAAGGWVLIPDVPG